MTKRPGYVSVFSILLLISFIPAICFARDEWPAVQQDELTMKDYPAAPDAAAVILEREMYTDDNDAYETHYLRIKVLKEEGKKWADVELPYFRNFFHLEDVKARTIEPDGRVVPFNGKVYDKEVIKARQFKYMARAFSFSDVQVGSILEYKYRLTWDPHMLYATKWLLQQDLPTRHAHFTIRVYPEMTVNWIWAGLPNGVKPVEKNKTVEMQVSNIAGMDDEDDMPPKEALQSRVEFFYTEVGVKADDFWKNHGKAWHQAAEDFMNRHDQMRAAVATIVQAQDSPDVKLHKIYARVQQLRNLSYEEEKSEREIKVQDIRENKNVEDVLHHGYGYQWELNTLFVALAHAAGFDAHVVRVSERDSYFFNQGLLDQSQLDGEVALIRQTGKPDLYLDPATPHCPFGLLPWEKTGVAGLLLEKDGGTFVKTPLLSGAAAVAERKGQFSLQPDGSISGSLDVAFSGLRALQWRLSDLHDDEVTRRKDLEDNAREVLPDTAQVKLVKMDGWEGTDEPLTAHFDVTIPGYASRAGHRVLLPVAIVHRGYRFQNTHREYPVYLRFPERDLEEVTLQIPPEFTVESVPTKQASQVPFGSFDENFESKQNVLHVSRQVDLEGIVFPTNAYGMLRDFYQTVRKGDEQQAVLKAANATH